MKYIELTVHTSTFGSELVSDILWEYSQGGVAINDINDVIELSKSKRAVWDYIDDEVLNASKVVLCKGFLELETAEEVIGEIENRLAELKKTAVMSVGSLEIVKREIDGDAWLETWKEHFKPIHIGERVVICPEWIKYDKKEGEIVTRIDSNMAFGTGEHETTSMCIELLQEYIKPSSTVIDVGCGSGILGITAEKLGAEKVLMTDIDEYAVEAANHNARINGVSKYEVLLKNLLDDQTLKGDIILANIMAEVLVMFSSGIKNNLKNGGVIILSGILNTKKQMVLSAYLKAGFKYLKEIVKGEWCALALQSE